MGLKIGVKGHILFDLHSKEVFLSRDVIYFENSVPYQSKMSTYNMKKIAYASPYYLFLDDIVISIFSFMSYLDLSSAHKHFTLNISSIPEPNTYEEAMCNENWRLAMKFELTALMKNNT